MLSTTSAQLASATSAPTAFVSPVLTLAASLESISTLSQAAHPSLENEKSKNLLFHCAPETEGRNNGAFFVAFIFVPSGFAVRETRQEKNIIIKKRARSIKFCTSLITTVDQKNRTKFDGDDAFSTIFKTRF